MQFPISVRFSCVLYATRRSETNSHRLGCNYVSLHYNDVIMGAIASQITSLTVVYSTVYSEADQRKHQSSASLAFVWGIHRDRWIPRTKASYAENVSIWWRHHVPLIPACCTILPNYNEYTLLLPHHDNAAKPARISGNICCFLSSFDNNRLENDSGTNVKAKIFCPKFVIDEQP